MQQTMLEILLENNLTITTTIAGFHLNKDSAPVLDELKIS